MANGKCKNLNPAARLHSRSTMLGAFFLFVCTLSSIYTRKVIIHTLLMSHATVLKEWPDYYASIECTLNIMLFSGCSVLHWY